MSFALTFNILNKTSEVYNYVYNDKQADINKGGRGTGEGKGEEKGEG